MGTKVISQRIACLNKKVNVLQIVFINSKSTLQGPFKSL